jgi:hypothetical protein
LPFFRRDGSISRLSVRITLLVTRRSSRLP